MAQLTPQQIQQYYATEGKKPNPLMPLDWLKTQTTSTTITPQVPSNNQNIAQQLEAIKQKALAIQPQIAGATGYTNPTPTPTPTPTSQANMTGGTSGGLDWDKMMALWEKSESERARFQKMYEEQALSQPTYQTPQEIYTQTQNQLGIPQAQQAVTTATQQYQGTQQQIANVENLINDLEKNIQGRVSAMGGQGVLTKEQADRQLALSQKPLMGQLETLQRTGQQQALGVQSAQAALSPLQQQATAMTGLAGQQQTQQQQEYQNRLQALQNLAGYKSPYDEFIQNVMQTQAKAQIEQQYAKPNYETVGAGQTLIDPNTGKVIYQAPQSIPTPSIPSSYNEWNLAGGQSGTGMSYAEWLTYEKNAGKVPTQAEQTVAGYASRLEQAEPTLKSTESVIVGMNPLSFSLTWDKPSWMQSAELQQYMQAARNFINAVLRRESGAVISPTEFSEARQQYLPQPGDDEKTLKLKEANRKLVFENLKKAAGNAYSSLGELTGKTTTTQSGSGVDLGLFEVGNKTSTSPKI